MASDVSSDRAVQASDSSSDEHSELDIDAVIAAAPNDSGSEEEDPNRLNGRIQNLYLTPNSPLEIRAGNDYIDIPRRPSPVVLVSADPSVL
jgi:hypothetical protein